MQEIIKTAEEIAKKVKEVEEYKKDLKGLESTQEFTTLIFKGEDGAEHIHTLTLGWGRDTNDKERRKIARQVHEYTKKALKEKIAELEHNIIKLVERIKNHE